MPNLLVTKTFLLGNFKKARVQLVRTSNAPTAVDANHYMYAPLSDRSAKLEMNVLDMEEKYLAIVEVRVCGGEWMWLQGSDWNG